MSVKKPEMTAVIWRAVRTGCGAVGIALLLMLPAAALIRQGILPYAGRGWIAGCGAFLAGVIASIPGKRDREGRLPGAVFAMLFAALVLAILSYGLFDSGPHPGAMLTVLAALGAGILGVRIIQFNKKYTKRKPRKKNITNSNQSRRLT